MTILGCAQDAVCLPFPVDYVPCEYDEFNNLLLVGDKHWPSQSASSVPITCSDVVDQLLQHTTCKSIHPFELVSSSTLLITSAMA